jgi:hypothetical protein
VMRLPPPPTPPEASPDLPARGRYGICCIPCSVIPAQAGIQYAVTLRSLRDSCGYWMPACAGMTNPCRDASASGFWGERRAEKRKPMVSAILTDHGGRLSARHTRRWSAAGPALRCRRNAGRSASSWQGFVVSPEGAPSRPEADGATHRPAGAAPHPAFTTPRDSAPQRMRWPESSAGAARGDKFASASYRRKPVSSSRRQARRKSDGSC